MAAITFAPLLVSAALLSAADEPERELPPGNRGGALLPTLTQLPPEPILPPAPESPIDLPTALRLAEVANPRIALGREAIREALALQLDARSMMLPSLNAGTNYHIHTGNLQQSSGNILYNTQQSLYVGGGAGAIAGGTVQVPAVSMFGQLTDAIFAPLVARQVVSSRSADSVAIENSLLLQVATRYLELVGAEARLNAFRNSLTEFSEVERLTGAFAKAGQGREGDHHRAQAEARLAAVEECRAQERVAVAAAELSRLLHLDPATRLTALSTHLNLVQLVDPNYDLEQLTQIAFAHRPEIVARTAAIGAAEFRVKQERARPFLPLISVGYSAGGFGGGGDRRDLGDRSMFEPLRARTDFDAWAIWNVQNLGAGNMSLQKQARAERDQAVSQRGLAITQVQREVAAALAASEAMRRRVFVAHRQLQTAEAGAWEELLRTRAGESLPIETLNSMTLLSQSRQDAIDALVGYDVAQFRLFVAIGETPTGGNQEAQLQSDAGVGVPEPAESAQNSAE